MMANRPTPTPIPASAPVDNPLFCVLELVGNGGPDELLCEAEIVGEVLEEELLVEVAKLYPSTGTAIRIAESVNVVAAAAKEFVAGEAYVRLWPEVRGDVQTPSMPGFAGRLRTKVKLVGQQIMDVLVSETMIVLAVVYAEGHTRGPRLQLVITLETVEAPSHHCVASGGRHVNELATDCANAGS